MEKLIESFNKMGMAINEVVCKMEDGLTLPVKDMTVAVNPVIAKQAKITPADFKITLEPKEDLYVYTFAAANHSDEFISGTSGIVFDRDIINKSNEFLCAELKNYCTRNEDFAVNEDDIVIDEEYLKVLKERNILDEDSDFEEWTFTNPGEDGIRSHFSVQKLETMKTKAYNKKYKNK